MAAQLGKQLLDKNAELTEQLEEVDRLYNDLKEKHDHLVAQYTSATTVRSVCFVVLYRIQNKFFFYFLFYVEIIFKIAFLLFRN